MSLPDTLPDTMRAIDPREPGGPETLRIVERPVPRPSRGEVLLRVAAAGVNRPDVMQRQGRYPPPPSAPTILGLEVAGTVAAVGEGVPPALLGTRQCALLAGGGYAGFAVAPAGQCLPVPDALPLEQAAALPETLFTVWHNLFQRGGAEAGDHVLVHGGTSGIGTTALTLGRLFGLVTLVTVGGAAKAARARDLGAALAIDYHAEDFGAAVDRFTDGRGVDVVLDMIGGDYLPRNLACLADEGRHVSIAVQRGAEATLPIWTVMRRRLTLTGSTLRARDAAFKAALRDDILARAWPFAADGRLRPVIDRVFPFADAAGAHRRMEEGGHVGKLVLRLD